MKTLKQLSKRSLSVFLAFLMIVYYLPLATFASTSVSQSDLSQGQSIDNSTDADDAFEITRLREENVKHFRLSDGSYVAAQYKTAVHYLDEDGNWQDIDNSLSEIGDEISTGNSRVKFSKKLTGNGKIFTLKNGSNKITLSLVDGTKGTPVTVTSDGKATVKAATKFEELSTLSSMASSLKYNGALPGVDLEYILSGNSIKENIIVNEQCEQYVFTFELSLGGLTASLENDGSVVITDEKGEALYIMPAPYMYDAAKNYSENVSYALSTSGNGKYTLTVSADSDWINSDDRVFPVTIDPTLDGYEDFTISDTYISTGNPKDSFSNEKRMYVGNYCGCTQYGLIMLNSLPSLPTGSTVTNLSLTVHVTDKIITSGAERRIEARKVTSMLSTLDGVTWNSGVSYSSDIYDYVNITDDSTILYTLDLTRMYHDWESKDSSSRVLQLSLGNHNRSDYVKLASTEGDPKTVIFPIFSLTYINTIGIEDSFSYRTQSAGAAGTVYINDMNGQITLSRTDVVSDNSALTTSVGHVYNSALANSDYSVVKLSTGSNMFAKMKTGKGFMLSCQQTLQMLAIGNASYAVLTDSDGTLHYFPAYYADSTQTHYKDLEGMGVYVHYYSSQSDFESKFKAFADLGFSASGSLMLQDVEGNCLLFYKGLPAVFSDLNGNLVKYLYNTTSSSGTDWFPKDSDNQLRAIVQNNRSTDKNGKDTYTDNISVATFSYNSSYYLTSIVSTGRSLVFTYDSSGYLTKVHAREWLNSESSATTYDLAKYAYTNGLLTDAYDIESKYGIHYTFKDGKCSSYYEFAGTISSHTKGGYYDVCYNPGETVYKFANVKSGDSSDDIITTNVYDYYGRTVCSYIKDAYNNVISASAGSYIDSDDFSNNSIANSSSIGAAVSNLLDNPSFEKSTPLSGWGTSGNGRVTYDTSYVRTGSNSVKFTSQSSSSTEILLSKAVTGLKTGKYYFSVYVNTSALKAAEGGVYLKVSGSDGSSVTSKMYNGNIGYTDPKSSKFVDDSDQWQRIGVEFDAVSTKTYTLYVSAKKIVGALYFDDAQLERSDVINEYNLLSAGSNGWTCSSDALTYTSDPLHPIDCFKITGTMNDTVHLSQTVKIHASRRGYTLSGWAKANAVPSSVENTIAGNGRKFGLKATIKYCDNSIDNETVCIPFNYSNTDWQYISGTVLPGRSDKVDSITVEFDYTNNCNTAYVARIALIESDAIGYTYDSNGHLTATTKAGLQKSTYTYSGTKLTSFANGSIDANIEYDVPQNGQLPSSITANGIKTEYTYDRAGNVIGVVIRPSNSTSSSMSMVTSSTFNNKLSKLQSSTNQLGTVTSYTYNTDGSLKTSTLDGVETEYLYNRKGRYSQVTIENMARAAYSYTDGNLTSIHLGGLSSTSTLLTYQLSYDAFGRMTSIGMLDRTLASYTYQNVTGLPLTVTYENGFVISYSYDDLGRTTLIKYNGTNAFGYVYDGNGNVCEFTDHLNGVVYQYTYNSHGNIVSEEQYKKSNGTFLQGQYYRYNNYGDLKSSALTVPGVGTTRYVCSYGYNDQNYSGNKANLTKWDSPNSGHSVGYKYDGLNRLESTSTNNVSSAGTTGVSINLKKTYSYLTNSSGKATSLVSGLTYSGVSKSYSYSYDNRGNITKVYENGTLKASYEYDSLGQLKRENNADANKTWVYSYDVRGNITSRKTYAYTTGTLGTVQKTDSYGYYEQWVDEVWNDGLKSYNGSAAFTYDAIGNPLTYNNGSAYTFTWSNGRQLASGTKGTKSFTYTYNSDGQRTSKTVGNFKYSYYWYGSKLAMMTVTNLTSGSVTSTCRFYYDANGTPVVLKYNGAEYYYVTNLQGDVTGLADSSGKVVAYYTYDAWGKIISFNYASEQYYSALLSNPLRYRGYICDDETEFYYLQSRYYDPNTGRWINADGQISGVDGDIRGYNLFAYCFNNPVNMIDPTGNWPSWGQVFSAVATVAVAAVFVAAVVASAGAVGVAAGVAAASIGATGTMVSVAITVGTYGTYVVAAGIGACALSNAGEILTGTNVIRDGLMGGDQEAYDTVQTALNFIGGVAIIIGQTNPGVTGNAAKPSQDAQSVHKVPTTGTPKTSFDKLYTGKPGEFQRTYYDFRGDMSLQIDFTTHNKPLEHSNPHLHTFWLEERQPQTNLWYLE